MVGPKEMRGRPRAIGWIGALVAVVLVLGACGGEASEVGADGGDEEAAVTTSSSDSSSTVPSASDPAATQGELACDGELAATVLAPPTVDGIGWQEQDPEAERLEELRALLPEDLGEAWQRDVMAAVADGGPTTYEEVIGFLDTVDLVARWARSQCPEAPPSWTCTTDDGPEVDAVPAPADPALAATPEEVLAELDDGGDALELDRTDAAVLYGWADETGALERTVRVARVGADGWKAAAPTVCLDDADREEMRALMELVEGFQGG